MGGEAYDWLSREKLLPTFSRAFNDYMRSILTTITVLEIRVSFGQVQSSCLHTNLVRSKEAQYILMKFNKLADPDTFRWDRIKDATLVGMHDMPQLKPCVAADPRNPIGFHAAKSLKEPSVSWFHFYEDDYQFERLWNRPGTYLDIIKRFEGGISPDFSMYIDMPKAQQIWNCWRNRAMAYWMQEQGINVIPNACWGDADSLAWAFDGLPEDSVLAITTQGCMQKTDYRKQILVNGIHELIRQKHPTKLVVYGKFPDPWKERFSIPIETLPTFAEQKWGCR